MLAAMRKATSKGGTVSVVGPGRLGSALAVNLAQVGYQVKFLVTRPGVKVQSESTELARRVGAQIVALGRTTLDTKLVWIAVSSSAKKSWSGEMGTCRMSPPAITGP